MRAHSVLIQKAVNDDLRQIVGWATTPNPDRVNDIVVSSGVKAAADIPLLLNHSSAHPVGRAYLGKATAKGLPFRATIAKITEPGVLKDRCDEAWHSVKSGLITGVSIAFNVVRDAVEPLANGGRKYLECEVFELSLTPIPANSEALITGFKRLEAHHAGRRPGAVYLTPPRKTGVVYY